MPSFGKVKTVRYKIPTSSPGRQRPERSKDQNWSIRRKKTSVWKGI
jgi:hypothetical protein